RVLHRRLLHGDVGKLQVGVEREQHLALLHLVAFAHRERLDAPGLVGTDENQLRLHPALEDRLLAVVAARQQESRQQDGDAPGDRTQRAHGALLPPNSKSMWARMSSATFSGSNRSNRLLQITAIRAGATSNCGKRASASSASSPRSTASLSRARSSGNTRP